MPREIIAVAPDQLEFRKYEDPTLKTNEIRMRSVLSAEKHGTGLLLYRGMSAFSKKVYDPKLGLFMEKETRPFPMSMGNMTVGIVTELGDGVTRFRVGDRVYGYLPIRETHTVNEERVQLAPPETTEEELVCIDPAVVALMSVREGNIKIGDKVAIFGLGAIGLMAIQLAKMSGSILVIGIEPMEKRRTLARKYGADILLDPKQSDSGLEIRRITKGDGVDTAIETSGSYHALHQAIRGTRYGGTVVPVSWYHGEPEGLDLGEEWHFNRQVMVSGARVESEPYRDHPRWDSNRIYETVIQLFMQKRLNAECMLDPVVRFDQAIEAYRTIIHSPEKAVKLAVKYE